MAEAPPASPLEAALARVGDRWALLVVDALLHGPRRFGELQQEVRGIASNVLSTRLRQLETQGLVVARPYSQRPPRSAYELTGPGRDLAGALRLLAEWGAGVAGDGAARRHPACGTPLEARWYCPTCARSVDDHETEDLRYL
ncbi:MAG TPA: helix-turn-helix domain-containing protein [Acidimicrobiales bacterium]|nr:helix-turn-helix domain-containing protein [Acidimicrobiales bacterium]